VSLAEALEVGLERAARLRPLGGKLPHVTGDDGRWQLLSPVGREQEALTGLPWTGGFVAGQLWLAGERESAAEVTALLAPRAAQPTTHDLGFLFWPSAVLGGERELGLRAAATLVERVLPSGVIQVIGALDDPAWHGRTIVDTWPNLRLLWWAEQEGFAEGGAVARAHLEATLDALLRPDGSTFHAARIADDGSVLERGTVNGYADDSTWARGQAWAIHGLVSAAYRQEAERAARWFLEHLPADRIPPWDFDRDAPKDSSAAAIAASALLELGWDDEARRLLEALTARCLNHGEGDGILLHCAYRPARGLALDCASAWGDFFFLDALLREGAPDVTRGSGQSL
jgi:unsaturated chondroitin disaccharide hydrolase